MKVKKRTSVNQPFKGSNSRVSLSQKTDKLYEAAHVISQTLNALEQQDLLELPKSLSQRGSENDLAILDATEPKSLKEKSLVEKELVHSSQTLRPSSSTEAVRIPTSKSLNSLADLADGQSVGPYQSYPNSVFADGESPFGSTQKLNQIEKRAPLLHQDTHLYEADVEDQGEKIVKTMKSSRSPSKERLSKRVPDTPVAPVVPEANANSMMMLLLSYYEKENLELKSQLLSKSSLDNSIRKSQDELARLLADPDEKKVDVALESLERVKNLEEQVKQLKSAESQGLQRNAVSTPTLSQKAETRDLTELRLKLSRSQMEIKSLVEQNEILRSENKKWIENATRPKSPRSRELMTIDLAAQEALLSTLDIFAQKEEFKEHAEAKGLAERISKTLRSAAEKTYDENALTCIRQSLYACQEALEQWVMNTQGLDARIAKVAQESTLIRKETEQVVADLEKQNETLIKEKEKVESQVVQLQEALTKSQSALPKEIIKELPPLMLDPKAEETQRALDRLEFENVQLKTHQVHLEQSIQEWKSENSSLRKSLEIASDKPSESIHELQRQVAKTQGLLDQESLSLAKANALVKHLEEEIQELKRESSPLSNAHLLMKLAQPDAPTTNGVSFEQITQLFQENQLILDQLTELKVNLQGAQSRNKHLTKENHQLKGAIDSIQEKLSARESEWQSKFQEFQKNAESIQSHHAELNALLTQYDGQYQGFQVFCELGESKGHPHPFLSLGTLLHKDLQGTQHSLEATQERLKDATKDREHLSREIHTQRDLLESLSLDKTRLAQQNSELQRHKQETLTQLDESLEKEKCARDECNRMEHKMKRILQAFASSIV